MMPLSTDLSGSSPPVHPPTSRSTRSSAYMPITPRHGATKPVSTMNVLITIAICLQVYQIYLNTPHHTPLAVDHRAKTLTASFYDFPKGQRRAFDPQAFGTYNNPYGEDNHQGNNNNNLNPSFSYPNQDLVPEQQADEVLQLQRQLDFVRQQREQYANNGKSNTGASRNWNDHAASKDKYKIDPDDVLKYRDQLVNAMPIFRDNDDDDAVANRTTEAPFQYSKYNYSLPAVRTNYTLPTQPIPSNESNIAVIILSARSNFERRQVIRETWKQNHTNVLFVIGGPEPDNHHDKDMSNHNSTSYRLFREQQTYADLLDTIHPDTYRGLPYKLHYAVQWIAQHPKMKHIQWILKADDDVLVRLHTLQYYVLRKFNPTIPMVIGRMEPNSKPHRTGKWAEDPKFDGDQYPPWAYGSTGYVMSRPIADYLASSSSPSSLYYYQGEDVSLGIWLYQSPLDITWIDSPDFNLEHAKWFNHKYSVVIGHDLSPEAIREVFDKWKDPPMLLDHYHTNHAKQKGRIYQVQQKIWDEEVAAYYDESLNDAFFNEFDLFYRDRNQEGSNEYENNDSSKYKHSHDNEEALNPWGEREGDTQARRR